MKKITLFFLLAFLSFNYADYAQCPVNTFIALGSQIDVDNFAVNYPGCTMPDHLYISGPDITNLNGLSQITAVVNFVNIYGYSTGNPGEYYPLVDISGLNNITNIGGTLDINNIPWVNATNIFPNLIHIKNLNFDGKFPFTISGFNGLATIGENFTFQSTAGLNAIDGFSNLTSVGLPGANNALSFISNVNLTTISGFESLSSVNMLNLNGNQNLVGLPNFESLSSIYTSLNINNCASLVDLSGLDNLQTVGSSTVYGSVSIYQNSSLNNLGLNSLSSIGGALQISDNPQLTSLSALQNLNSIGTGTNGSLYIANNTILTSLSGLHNIQPNTIGSVTISGNLNLSTCAIASICGKIALDNSNGTQSFNVSNNAVNCNSIAEISNACNLSVNENSLENGIKIFPNPVCKMLNIGNATNVSKVIVSDITGRTAIRSNSSDTAIDVSQLQKGVYILSVFSANGMSKSKFIKE